MSDDWTKILLSDGTTFDVNKDFGYQLGFDLDKESRKLIEIATDGDRWRVPFMGPCDVGLMQFACGLVERLRSELLKLRDYTKCLVENNEALQKENAELRDRVVDLEQEVEYLRHDLDAAEWSR